MFHQMNKPKITELDSLGKEELDKKQSDAKLCDKPTITS
jgi:hypothetical protein